MCLDLCLDDQSMSPQKALTRKQVAAFSAMLLIGAWVRAQEIASASFEADCDTETHSDRSDIRRERMPIIAEVMQLSKKDAAAFLPVYKDYEAAMSLIDDERVAYINTYEAEYLTMTEAWAKSMMERIFDLESRRAELKHQSYSEFNNASFPLGLRKAT
jgi:hypothetical protein